MADQFFELLGKCRARHSDILHHFVECPGELRVAVQKLQCLANSFVGKGRNKLSLLAASKVDSNQFYKYDFSELIYYQFSTRLLG